MKAAKILLVTISLVVGLLLCSSENRLLAQQNIVRNGSFEEGWQNGPVDWGWTYNVGLALGATSSAADGASWVDVFGTLYQNLTTTPGQKYHLRFALAGNSNISALTIANIVWGGTSIGSVSWNPAGHNINNMGWVWAEFDVTAYAPSTRLTFENPFVGDGSGRILRIDAVSVVVAPKATPPIIMCPDPLLLECMGGSAIGILQAGVMDTNGLPLEVVWTVNDTAYQTNDIPSGGAVTASNVTFTADFESGEHTVTVSASNGRTIPATCSTMVTVGDTLPPDVSGIYATPDLLWPPNRSMVPVSVVVNVADDCDPSPAAHITQVISNEPLNPFVPDWEITGPLSVNLRAERLGSEGGRIYTIVVESEDSSGNVSHASVDVVVPHDYR